MVCTQGKYETKLENKPEYIMVQGSTRCPAGYAAITDEAECHRAHAALAGVDAGSSAGGARGGWPAGCFFGASSRKYLFNHGGTVAQPHRKRGGLPKGGQGGAICKSAETLAAGQQPPPPSVGADADANAHVDAHDARDRVADEGPGGAALAPRTGAGGPLVTRPADPVKVWQLLRLN